MLEVMFIVAASAALSGAWWLWREYVREEERAQRKAARSAAFAAVPRVRAGPCVDVLRMQPSHRPVIWRVRP